MRLSRIDDLTRPDHTFLTPADECFYVGEYTARAGYAFSETNDVIQNLKKPMARRALPEWRYKGRAIARSAEWLQEVLNPEWVSWVTFVPVPPSKRKDHPDYDDRLLQILHRVGEGRRIDIRELVMLTQNAQAAHHIDERRSVDALIENLAIDLSLAMPIPEAICIFDDVLTTGAHFQAVRQILSAQFPGVPIAGLFIARRAPESSLI